MYDCIFKRDPGYNQKLHRDDREHAKGLGLHVNQEVRLRILISSDRWTVHAQLFITVSGMCLAFLCAALLSFTKSVLLLLLTLVCRVAVH